MKKILAVLMALCLALAGFAMAESAVATSDVEVNWADLEPVLKESGVEGEFHTFDEVAVKIWLPSELQPVETSEEEKAEGYIAYFSDAEQSTHVLLTYADADGASVEDFGEIMATQNGATDVTIETINGLKAVTYILPDSDSLNVCFATESGYLLNFTMMPYSQEGADVLWAMVAASIQPE